MRTPPLEKQGDIKDIEKAPGQSCSFIFLPPYLCVSPGVLFFRLFFVAVPWGVHRKIKAFILATLLLPLWSLLLSQLLFFRIENFPSTQSRAPPQYSCRPAHRTTCTARWVPRPRKKEIQHRGGFSPRFFFFFSCGKISPITVQGCSFPPKMLMRRGGRSQRTLR